MSRRSGWYRRFRGAAPEPRLRSWLTEPGSLTARCQRQCADFRVRLLAQGKGAALADEAGGPALVRVREVVLECDGVPVIFAHTTLSAAANGRLTRWLSRLGTRSLGSLLFFFPGFHRGGIEYRRLDRRHPLYRRAAMLGAFGEYLWARRSAHRLGGQQVLVTEVFLPEILRLK
ncbi:chorismate--pyruvate lyase family protein [Dechloromonas denitrificans]|uniref:chorismate--pyruvate lyase family protein n=1 Tax=Dechloromonas denitrificans TaxID=281362 RepID=UPI001CF89AC0|nr:chorismate lyase [Dechloromonas denitrificans]UCV04787.1 chorismate lyase [Dechloromonas denitrificans]